MLSYTISNKLTKRKNQRVPQNLDNPKNGQTLEQGWALGNFPYTITLYVFYQCNACSWTNNFAANWGDLHLLCMQILLHHIHPFSAFSMTNFILAIAIYMFGKVFKFSIAMLNGTCIFHSVNIVKNTGNGGGGLIWIWNSHQVDKCSSIKI